MVTTHTLTQSHIKKDTHEQINRYYNRYITKHKETKHIRLRKTSSLNRCTGNSRSANRKGDTMPTQTDWKAVAAKAAKTFSK